MREYKRPHKMLPRVNSSHEGDWVRACKADKGGLPASSNFCYGGPLTEMALLGMVALRVKDQILNWNSEELKFTNNELANQLVHYQYRGGWKLD